MFSPDLTRRVGLTALILTGLTLARRVPYPGLDLAVIAETGTTTEVASALVLGISPWLSAYLFVEVGCLTRDRWRSLRVGTPDDRALLDKAVARLWVVLCLVQSFAIAVSSEQVLGYDGDPLVPDPGWGFRMLTMATLTAGSAIFGLAAAAIDRWGFGRGFALLAAIALVEQTLPGLEPLLLFSDEHRTAIVPVLVAVAGTSYGTWRLLRTWRPVGLPLMTAGLLPARMGLAIPTIIGLLWSTFDPWSSTALAIALAVAVVATVPYATVFHLPWNVAPVAGVSEDAAWAAVRSTLPWAGAVSAVLVATYWIPWFGPSIVDTLALATLFAFAWDLHAEWVARRTLGDVVPIWPLHRVYAVPAALGALETKGIRAHVRGLRFRQLTHFLAPYVPIEVLVARTDAERARAQLATTVASWHPMPLPPARSSLLADQAAS